MIVARFNLSRGALLFSLSFVLETSCPSVNVLRQELVWVPQNNVWSQLKWSVCLCLVFSIREHVWCYCDFFLQCVCFDPTMNLVCCNHRHWQYKPRCVQNVYFGMANACSFSLWQCNLLCPRHWNNPWQPRSGYECFTVMWTRTSVSHLKNCTWFIIKQKNQKQSGSRVRT